MNTIQYMILLSFLSVSLVFVSIVILKPYEANISHKPFWGKVDILWVILAILSLVSAYVQLQYKDGLAYIDYENRIYAINVKIFHENATKLQTEIADSSFRNSQFLKFTIFPVDFIREIARSDFLEMKIHRIFYIDNNGLPIHPSVYKSNIKQSPMPPEALERGLRDKSISVGGVVDVFEKRCLYDNDKLYKYISEDEKSRYFSDSVENKNLKYEEAYRSLCFQFRNIRKISDEIAFYRTNNDNISFFDGKFRNFWYVFVIFAGCLRLNKSIYDYFK